MSGPSSESNGRDPVSSGPQIRGIVRRLTALRALPAWSVASQALRSRLARAGGLIFAANLASGVLNVLAVVVTIRHLGPSDFGLLTVAITTMQFIGIASNVGLNETLMTLVSRAEASRRPEDVAPTLAVMLRLRMLVSAVILAAGLPLARPVASAAFGMPELGVPLAAAVVGACGVSFLQFSLTKLQAFRAYGAHATVVLVRFAVLLTALLAVAALDRLDLWATLAINVGAPFVALGTSLCFRAARVGGGAGPPSRILLARIWDLSKWTTVMNFFGTLFTRVEIYLLTAFASPLEVGLYGAALRLCGGILTLEAAVRTVLFPEVSRRSGTAALGPFVRRCMVVLCGVGVLVYAIGVAITPVVPVVLGEAYRPAIAVFLVLLAARTAIVPLVPLGLLFFATGRIRAGALATATQVAALILGGLVLIPRYGAMGAAWTSVGVTVVVAVYMGAFARRYLRRDGDHGATSETRRDRSGV